MVSHVPNLHLGMYKNYPNFCPLIFYWDTRLRRSAPLGWNRVKRRGRKRPMKTIKRRSRKGLCAGPKGGIDGPAAQEMRTLVVAEKGSHNKISSMYFCIGRRATTTHNKISYHIKISSIYFCIREHPQPITSAIENLHWKLFFENYNAISPKKSSNMNLYWMLYWNESMLPPNKVFQSILTSKRNLQYHCNLRPFLGNFFLNFSDKITWPFPTLWSSLWHSNCDFVFLTPMAKSQTFVIPRWCLEWEKHQLESSLKSLLSPLPTLSGVRAPRQSPKAERELIFFP